MSPPRFWTNPSAIALLEEGEPMAVIEARARELALEAMEAGWSGPPFDPFELARIRGISVIAREDLADARLSLSAEGSPQIEYNPTRPRGRLRFNIAHELAHTLFSDHAEFARYRAGARQRPDEWQLELLCDVAAAELLMPLGSFAELADEPAQIERLMELRREYDVSTEALLLRVVKLTAGPAAVVAASRLDGNEIDSDFRVDYVAHSRSPWESGLERGTRVSADSVLGECTAVGYTAKGWHALSRETADVRVECVGIPPYPGQTLPRVVGLLLPRGASERGPELVEIYGDAREPRGEPPFVVAHLVNDRTPNWGGEFAKALKERYPETQREFRAWVGEERSRLRLGNVHFLEVTDALVVASMVAQHGYGPATEVPRVRYSVLRDCLKIVGNAARERQASVHMPRIGTGGGGGDWRVIRELVDQVLVKEGVPVVVYGPPETKPPVPAQQMLSLT
jgi:Zn-dependent peptidase ImmA (M78 family)/O-acetyl-ADP-ribose deacetylase (regulator of RNase III)